MNRVIYFFSLLIFLLCSNQNIYSQSDSIKFDLFKTFNSDSCKKDIEILKNILLSVHPGINLHTTPEKISAFTDSIKSNFHEKVSGIEFYNSVSLILAQMKDGHTFINWQESASQVKEKKFPLFPLQVTLLNNRYYIKNSIDKKFRKYIGNEILSVNGKAFEKIAENLYSHTSTEGTNTSSHDYALVRLPLNYFLLEDTAGVFNVQVKNSKGKVTNINLKGVPLNEINNAFYPTPPPIEYEIRDRIAILKVHTFITTSSEDAGIDFKKYFIDFFSMLREENVTKLLLDLRGDEGGRPVLSNELFSWLYPKSYYYFGHIGFTYLRLGEAAKYIETDFNPGIDSTKQKNSEGLYCYTEADSVDAENMLNKLSGKENAFNGKIAALIDGGCFSTTGHFIALLKGYHLAELIGTCSQGSYYSNDGGTYFKLPRTGLSARIPAVQYKMRVPDFTYDSIGICPDIFVEQTPDDLKTGFDRQLDEALKYLQGN